jgi:hypothetical protein
LLRRAPGKGSTPTKRLKAGWNDDYMLLALQESRLPKCGSPTVGGCDSNSGKSQARSINALKGAGGWKHLMDKG